MRVLFVGLGSIGSRHLKNLALELRQRGTAFTVDTLRSGDRQPDAELSQYISKSFTCYSQLEQYDAAFITNPTALHLETLKKLVPRAKNIFIEKPVFTDADVRLDTLGLKQDSHYYVACPLRRSPVLRRVAEIISADLPTAVRAICSSYLPQWRPKTDYKNSYSANPSLGGGVRRDLIHEWDYLTSLFGFPTTTKSFYGKKSALEIDSEDTAVYVAEYPSLLLSLHVDYTGRAARRELELFLPNETVVADIQKNEIRYLVSQNTERFSPVDIHRLEMCYFLDLCGGLCDNINPVDRAVKTLETALTDN